MAEVGLTNRNMAASTTSCLEWLLRPETVAGIRDGAPDYAQLAARLCKLSAVYAGMPGFCTGPLASTAQNGQAATATSTAAAGSAVTEVGCATSAAALPSRNKEAACVPPGMTPAVQLDLMRQELLKRQLDLTTRSRTPASPPAAASLAAASSSAPTAASPAPAGSSTPVVTKDRAPVAGSQGHVHALPVSPSRPVGPKALPEWAVVGAAVEGRWKQGSQWYAGKVVKIDNTGPNPQFSLRYADGDLENKMPISRVRPAAEQSAEDVPVAPVPISAGANIRVWETRNNLPPALRELLSFNSKGVGHGDNWDVVSTRDRKKTSIYTYTDTEAPQSKHSVKASGKRKGSSSSSDSSKATASGSGSRSHKKKKTPSTSAVFDSTTTAATGPATAVAAPPNPSPKVPLASLATTIDAMGDSDDEPIALGAATAVDLASQQDPATSAKSSGRRKSQYTINDVFSCRYCSRQFNHRGNCSSHEATHQNYKPPPPIESNDPSKPYMCHLPHCHKAFGRISDHDMHFRSHREEMKIHVDGLKKAEAARLAKKTSKRPNCTPFHALCSRGSRPADEGRRFAHIQG